MKEQVISTQRLKTYKIINLILWLALFVLLVAFYTEGFSTFNFDWFRAYILFYWVALFYILYIKRTLRLRSIAYYHENIFIQDHNHEIIIPFTEVRDIKLRSLIRTHSVTLFRDMGFGKEFFFKSSLWYPFNFKKVDDQVYQLQKAVDKAKQNYRPENYKALGS